MAEELASPLHPLLDGPMVIRTHVREAPEGTVEALEGSGQIEATWALPDGRGWYVRCGQETSRSALSPKTILLAESVMQP
jgi:hypothetical protein